MTNSASVSGGGELNVANDVGTLKGDAVKLRQVLLNLLSNASKFTSGGRITLDVRRIFETEGVFIEFAVSDTGIGISAEDLPRIFAEFHQADNSTTWLMVRPSPVPPDSRERALSTR